jgi:chemotaxis protein histidine kinase CheA
MTAGAAPPQSEKSHTGGSLRVQVSLLDCLMTLAGSSRAGELDREAAAQKLADIHSLLLFHQAEAEVFAVPLSLVQRLEKIKASAVEILGGKGSSSIRGAACRCSLLMSPGWPLRWAAGRICWSSSSARSIRGTGLRW